MDEFDDILRNKLNESSPPPDSTVVWKKVNSGLAANKYNVWKTIAILSLLLWFMSIAYWCFLAKKESNNKTPQSTQLNSTVPLKDTIYKINTIRDTIVKKVYIPKWRQNLPLKAETNFNKANEEINDHNKMLVKTSNEDAVSFMPFLQEATTEKVHSNITEYKSDLVPLSALKLKTDKPETDKLAQFDFAFCVGFPQFGEEVIQKNGLAPKINASIIGLSMNYRLWKGFSFHTGISKEKFLYDASGITNAKHQVFPDPGNPVYVLDELKYDQSLWNLNTGISYNLKLKNKWLLAFESGLDWIISGTQNSSYNFTGNAYYPDQKLSNSLEAKPFSLQKAYCAAGIDIPVFQQFYLGYRIKKIINISKASWLSPDYIHELGINYKFY